MIALSIILLIISIGCFLLILSAPDGFIPLFILGCFFGGMALALPVKKEPKIEKNITVEVSDYHVYIYKKGEVYRGAIFSSDKAYDVQNAKRIIGLGYDECHGIFFQVSDQNKAIVFSD